MLRKYMKGSASVVVLGALAVLALFVPVDALAQAAAFDVSEATAALDDGVLTFAVIGVALCAAAAVMLAWRWVRGMFFGG